MQALEPGRFFGSLGASVKLGATAFSAARYSASSNVARMAVNLLIAVHERDKDVARSVGLSPERRGLHRTAEMDLFPSSCPDENASPLPQDAAAFRGGGPTISEVMKAHRDKHNVDGDEKVPPWKTCNGCSHKRGELPTPITA